MSTTLSEYTQDALEFENASWANGSVLDDPWYSVKETDTSAPPGSLLKLEKATNTSLYTLPPSTALSRFIHQSKTSNGTLVPVSAGRSPDAAPSHYKNLWQHYLAPFPLALQGYVVVATDYAGLGVGKDAHGADIIHEYLTSPAHANDVFYSVEAAQKAFPELSKQFVIAGHSQGGGSAWAAAQRQAVEPVPGYLGAVSISPVTKVLDMFEPVRSFIDFAIIPSIAAIFPEFNAADILTAEGVKKSPGWDDNQYVRKYEELVRSGGKPISRPMLVIHGEADTMVDHNSTAAAVEETASLDPEVSIEYLSVSGNGHNAGMTSWQWMWFDWIAKRFQGVPAEAGLITQKLSAPLSDLSYQAELNWWIASATVPYQTP